MIDTKQKILDTAERLFGERGYAAVSLRQVIGEAEVNVAAVHYHFGSKEDLLDAVLLRKIGPLTVERLARLERVEAAAGDGPPDLEGVLEAFLTPTAEMGMQNPGFVRFMGRMLTEGMMPGIVERHLQDTARRFIGALGRAVPHLATDELLLRIHFMIGAMAHTLTAAPIMAAETGPPDPLVRMRCLVAFLSAGFRAPAEGSGDASASSAPFNGRSPPKAARACSFPPSP
jgi:AcrR family transcriptional regulator